MQDHPPDEPARKPPNVFQLIGGILAAAVGIRSSRDRGQEFAQAGTLTMLLAILIFVGALCGGGYLFIQAVKRSAGM